MTPKPKFSESAVSAMAVIHKGTESNFCHDGASMTANPVYICDGFEQMALTTRMATSVTGTTEVM